VARHKIVVVTCDPLTPRMAGPAIRAFQMAVELATEHDVRLLTTSTCSIDHPTVAIAAASAADIRNAEQWCDVFVFQGLFMDAHPFIRRSEKTLVVDIYDPFHLEQLEHGRDADPHVRVDVVASTVAILNEQLARGDFFVCASEKQRDFWLGQLAGVGRINPLTYDNDPALDALIAVAPFGIDNDPPVKTAPAIKGVVPGIGPDDEVVLWGGGIYNWFDPLTLIRAVDRLRQRRPGVRLFFMGMRHPNPDVLEMRMAVAARQLAGELGLTGSHVFFNEGWVPYGERQNFLLDADVAVSTHLDHVEAAFSFRTRVLDYIWASLPIVSTGGDALAALVESKALGLTVPPGDVHALEDALFRVLDDKALAAASRQNAAALIPTLRWSAALEPLLAFCRSPRRAPDLVDADAGPRLRRTAAVAGRERRGAVHDLRSAARLARRGRVGHLVSRVVARVVRRGT